uniref:Uncharacterized protein n=1 Tax=Heterorhabditis bacteriophora TaxID=37862 RepID=A0A1I7X1L3_HETBA
MYRRCVYAVLNTNHERKAGSQRDNRYQASKKLILTRLFPNAHLYNCPLQSWTLANTRRIICVIE